MIQEVTLIEFGLSLSSQARLRLLFRGMLTPNIDAELALAAIFYDPDRLFSFEVTVLQLSCVLRI